MRVVASESLDPAGGKGLRMQVDLIAPTLDAAIHNPSLLKRKISELLSGDDVPDEVKRAVMEWRENHPELRDGRRGLSSEHVFD